jgi:3-hydroxypropanoate dehydrogenase
MMTSTVRHGGDRGAPASVSDAALDVLFREARSYNGWLDTPVSDDELRRINDLVRLGPTSANSSPARFIFVRSAGAKERLLRHVEPGNVAKSRIAPVTVIVGYDLRFYERLPYLFPHNPRAPGWYAGDAKRAHAADTAFRNGTLQGAYLIIAARALGLDCGPMSGFDRDGVDRDFWAGTSVRTNFLCNLGHGDPASLFARHPRLSFDDACTIA